MTNANDLTQYWYQGLPATVLQRLGFQDGASRWLIESGGRKIFVSPHELSPRQIVNIPENFRQVVSKLKELLLKMNTDPLADQYNLDELLAKLDQLIGAIEQQQQLLTSVQWGKVVGSLQAQTDLNTALATKVSMSDFNELFNQSLQTWLQERHLAMLP